MPANLPPQYFEAEKRYREAKTIEAKIEALQEMLMIMPKHKGTDKLRADLRRRISKLKSQSQQKKPVSKRESDYHIEKEGAAQIAIIGPPNTGKSSLIAALTNASPEIADFPHSTWKPLPGMAPYENIQFQLIDTPPLSKEYMDPLIADLIKRADILALLLDIQADTIDQWEKSIKFLNHFRIYPEPYPVPSDLQKQPFPKKMIVLVNKVDTEREEEDYRIFLELTEIRCPTLPISIKNRRNLKDFMDKIYDMAQIIRVYTKAPRKEPDLKEPFILPKKSTLEDLAGKIHKDFLEKLRYARIWGSSTFDGQMVQRDYVLQDGDVVELHL